MVPLPSSLRRLIKELAEIPSIGPRQATRIAFFLASEGRGRVSSAAAALRAITDIKTCERCFFIFEGEGKLCGICGDKGRDMSIVMIVEKETDLISLENTGGYKGRYLVLGQMPKTGLLESWQKERIEALRSFIAKDLGGSAKEIILALNPTSLGDFHASLLQKEFAGLAPKMSRLGRGLPQGGEIEFADSETLGSALESRS